MSEEGHSPKGQLLLRTLAMLTDTNANGDIFGGWIMSQLDLAGAILPKKYLQVELLLCQFPALPLKSLLALGTLYVATAYAVKLVALR